tara:strand:+ start:1343 stop:2494 length:1152 start_codon:yes stop_codon:yes gene_type:complete
MITQAIARSLKFNLIEQICSTWDPTDVGLPMLDGNANSNDDKHVFEKLIEFSDKDLGDLSSKELVEEYQKLRESEKTKRGAFFSRVPPEWAINCCESAESGGALLYLDEYSCTPPAVQAATLKIVGERKCGDLQLPENLSIAASANPADQAAGGWDLAPPAANRWCHLDFSLNVDEWCDGMLTGFPDPEVSKLPKGWEDLIPSKRVLVSSYIKRFGAEKLLNCPEDEASAGRAWPSPRSWFACARLLAAAEAIDADGAVVLRLVRGMVGDPATSFMTFIENLDLPDPELLLADPSMYEHPTRGDKAHVVLNSVVAAVLRKPTAKRWLAASEICRSASLQGGHDIACIPAMHLLKNQVSGVEIPDSFIELFPTMEAAGFFSGGK